MSSTPVNQTYSTRHTNESSSTIRGRDSTGERPHGGDAGSSPVGFADARGLVSFPHSREPVRPIDDAPAFSRGIVYIGEECELSEDQEAARRINEAIADWIAADPRNDFLEALVPDRPYDTDSYSNGKRDRQEVRGVTMRDVRDAFVVGAFEASTLRPEDYPKSLYGLPWENMDPGAVVRNALCRLEERMGIYPNTCVSHVDDDHLEGRYYNARSAVERVKRILEVYPHVGEKAQEVLREQAMRELWGVS